MQPKLVEVVSTFQICLKLYTINCGNLMLSLTANSANSVILSVIINVDFFTNYICNNQPAIPPDKPNWTSAHGKSEMLVLSMLNESWSCIISCKKKDHRLEIWSLTCESLLYSSLVFSLICCINGLAFSMTNIMRFLIVWWCEEQTSHQRGSRYPKNLFLMLPHWQHL